MANVCEKSRDAPCHLKVLGSSIDCDGWHDNDSRWWSAVDKVPVSVHCSGKHFISETIP